MLAFKPILEQLVEAAKNSTGEQRFTALFLAAALIFQPFSTDRKGAQKTLEQNGYSQIQTSGKPQYWACPQFSLIRTGFTANDPAGKPVHGAVCEVPRSPTIVITP
jgi:hypothetical protein